MPKGLSYMGTWVWGRPCLSAGLEVKPWQAGPLSVVFLLFPWEGMAPLPGKPVLSWLC